MKTKTAEWLILIAILMAIVLCIGFYAGRFYENRVYGRGAFMPDTLDVTVWIPHAEWSYSQPFVDSVKAEFENRIWLKSGMMQNGNVFERVGLERTIEGKDSGLLPTPRASDGYRWTMTKRSDCQTSISKVMNRSGNLSLVYIWIWNQISPVQASELVETMMGYPMGWIT